MSVENILGNGQILRNCTGLSRNVEPRFGYGAARYRVYLSLCNGRKPVESIDTAVPQSTQRQML